MPAHMIEAVNKILRARRQIFNDIGREATPEELAKKLSLPVERVRKILQIVKEPLSLETPIGEEEDSHLGDLIKDQNAVLASLTPREERIVRMRFGLAMNSDHTLGRSGPTVFGNARADSTDRG